MFVWWFVCNWFEENQFFSLYKLLEDTEYINYKRIIDSRQDLLIRYHLPYAYGETLQIELWDKTTLKDSKYPVSIFLVDFRLSVIKELFIYLFSIWEYFWKKDYFPQGWEVRNTHTEEDIEIFSDCI